MPTDKQREANRRNAQKSTGPRTEEGKRKSSLNGLRHGLFAKNYTLTPDEKVEHDRLLEAYIGHFRPEDPITLDLVEELAMAKMRQKRAWALESDLLRIELDSQRESHEKDFPDEKIEGLMALAVEWLVDESNGLETIRRYEGQLHRAWHKCLAQLERRLPPQRDKLQTEPNSAQPQSPDPLPPTQSPARTPAPPSCPPAAASALNRAGLSAVHPDNQAATCAQPAPYADSATPVSFTPDLIPPSPNRPAAPSSPRAASAPNRAGNQAATYAEPTPCAQSATPVSSK